MREVQVQANRGQHHPCENRYQNERGTGEGAVGADAIARAPGEAYAEQQVE